MNSDHPIVRALRSTWGALAVIAAAIAVGWVAALWYARLPATEAISDLEARLRIVERVGRVHSDSLGATNDRLVWVICTSVPPNRPDVLAALKVSCDYDSRTRNTIRGIPTLENDE